MTGGDGHGSLERATASARLNAGHADPAEYDRLRDGWLNRRRRWHFADVVEATRPAIAVELGCGTGRMLCELGALAPNTRFIGIEPIEQYVEHGRAAVAAAGQANVELHRGIAEEVSATVERLSADLIMSSDVLHHVESIERVVAEARSIARTGATWALVEPSAANPYVAGYQALVPGERNFRARPFLHVAERAGWTLAERGRMFMIPAFIDAPPRWLIEAERRFERFPVIAGAIRMELTAA